MLGEQFLEAKRHDEAMPYFQQACDFGAGCTKLAIGYRRGWGVAEDSDKALSIFEEDCSAGTGDSCYILANMYEAGTDLDRDMKKAAVLHEQACAGGSDLGCIKSGQVAENQVACASGDGEACYNAGVFYIERYGNGVDYNSIALSDPAKSRYHFEEACNAGYTKGCSELTDLEGNQ